MAKKITVMCLAICLLFSSCSRRNHYEDVLENKQESESDALLPQPGANGVANIIASNAGDYELKVIKKTSDVGYFEGNTEAQLYEKHQGNAYQYGGSYYLPTGRMIETVNGSKYFFNKLTGNISDWCSDPLCEQDDDCIWHWADTLLTYVGENHFYFVIEDMQGASHLYRCDFQRNNVELILEHAQDIQTIWYEKNSVLYFEQLVYANEGQASIRSLMALDMETGDVTAVSDNRKKINVFAIINDKVYFSYETAYRTIYQTDLFCWEPQKLWEDAGIESYNDRYILKRGKSNETRTANEYAIYHIDTGEWYDLGWFSGSLVLAGEYIYYTENLSEDEIANDPNKDYYTWTWDEEDIVINADITILGRKNISANTQGAGRIFRMNADGSKRECVLQIVYMGVPVRISSWSVDGECVWLHFNHYQEFKNYYNQKYEEDNGGASSPAHLAMADLQSGILRIIEIQE